MKIEAILIQQGVEKALLPDKDLLESVTEKEMQEFQWKTYNSIILSLFYQVLRKTSHEKTVAGVWKKLEELYRTRALPNRIYLREHLYGFKIEESKPIDDALDEFNKLVLDLESLDIKVEDEDKAIILLNSLPKSLKHFKETLKYGKDDITFDDVQNALNAKVLDMKSSDKTNGGESLTVRGRPHNKNNNGKWGKSCSKSKSKGKKDYRNVKCYHCNKIGHIRRICPYRQQEEKTQAQGSAAIIDDGYDSIEVLTITLNPNHEEWVLDSGCTYHMCPRRDWFSSYQEVNGGKLLLGNNMSCNVVGIGTMAINMHDGKTRTLKEVRHVPDLKRNLISLGTLDKSGYNFKAKNGKLTISKGAMVVMKGQKRNGLHILEGHTLKGLVGLVLRTEIDKTIL